MEGKKFKIKLSDVTYWVVLNLGTLILAAGVYFFKAPNNFATGGVSGLSIILAKFTTDIPWLGQTEIMTAINVLLLIIGFIFLGRGCGFKTAYCSLVYSGEMQIMKLIFPLEAGQTITGDVFLEFVYAMLLTAAGSAIIFNCRASSGGTDIIALIIKKYSKIKNVGTALLITDFFIAASTFFIFGATTGLFSILGLFTKAFVVDGVIESIGKNKFVTIITTHPEQITPFILEGIHRGFTSYKATGGYTNEEKTIIITVCKRSEALKLKLKIRGADPSAFVILTDTNEIVGKGFRSTL
ncbi:MAG: YitT family protein [Clostridia bacterium]|nr:YitT family protein [Clostridia bacterium]